MFNHFRGVVFIAGSPARFRARVRSVVEQAAGGWDGGWFRVSPPSDLCGFSSLVGPTVGFWKKLTA